jgi:hypothetical protein
MPIRIKRLLQVKTTKPRQHSIHGRESSIVASRSNFRSVENTNRSTGPRSARLQVALSRLNGRQAAMNRVICGVFVSGLRGITRIQAIGGSTSCL